jgi:CheY-like chemotaxis protein
MRVKFWGTRGSIPSPGRRTLRYGGNTLCVELRSDSGQIVILDCGTGLRELGYTLMNEAGPLVATILISHTHWDHTQGFAFFAPATRRENRFTIYAASSVDKGVLEVFSRQMDYLNFPIALEERPASMAFRELGEETFNLEDVQITAQYMNHTVLTLGYRISCGGASVVYATDHEPFSPTLYRSGSSRPSLADIVHAGDRRHVDFLRGADLVIHDAQYTAAELANRHNWGHSSLEYAVDVCVAAGVKQLAFIHHDPDRSDDEIEQLEAAAQARARAWGSHLIVRAAAEGSQVVLPEVYHAVPRGTGALGQPGRARRSRVLVVDDEPALVHYVEMVLTRDGYDILKASNGRQALDVIEHEHPDLVLLDLMMPEMDGLEVLEHLRSSTDYSDLPVIMLTAKSAEDDIVRSFEGGVTDYINKPAAASVLRSRVRRWLLSRE